MRIILSRGNRLGRPQKRCGIGCPSRLKRKFHELAESRNVSKGGDIAMTLGLERWSLVLVVLVRLPIVVDVCVCLAAVSLSWMSHTPRSELVISNVLRVLLMFAIVNSVMI